jgi:hypothetical protein
LTIAGPPHVGTYVLVRGTPPAAPATVKMPPLMRAEPVAPKKAPAVVAFPWDRLPGSWHTDPSAAIQVSFYVGRSKNGGTVINQLWTKGSDSPSLSKAGNYAGSVVGGHGVLTKANAEEGSDVPMVLNLAFEGDALVITVDNGVYAGQHRLMQKAK